MRWPKIIWVDDAHNWYKFSSVQAAILLAVLEAIQLSEHVTLPNWVSLALAVSIPVLRIYKQKGLGDGRH